MENGSYRHPSCRSIYSGMGFDRIDVFMTKCALSFMERIHTLDNDIVEKSHQYSESIDVLRTRRYLPPVALLQLRDMNLLYCDE